MSSDERLALRAAQGDQRAFEEIYGRYHQDLYRFCLAMVGNPADAQDALQNTMIKILRGLPGEKRQIKLKPWLYRIARNEAVEILRRRRDSSELEPEQMPVAAVTETAETRERLRTLLADLEQLPERQRAALVMRELSGFDFDQIGTAFGSSAAVARQTLYEARLSLRQLDAGREMRCDEVMRELSGADGRVTRRREIQAHLRTCADCRAFQDDIAKRHEDLAALAPLPIAASAGLLKGVLGSSASAATGGGLGGAVGAGAGKAIATSALVKGAATVAVVAVVGASAADRSGLIDVPLPGRGDDPAAQQGSPDSGRAGDAAVAAESLLQSPSSQGGRPSRGGGGAQTGDDRTMATEHTAAQQGSSRSHAGMNPPGGGYGRSASQRHGRPSSLPEASAKGQQTAAAHKPDGAGSPTSQEGANAQGQAQAGGAASGSKPSARPKADSPAAPQEPVPPSEAESHGQGSTSQKGKPGVSPGVEG
jgi:RNA polymerase sigma factor (sigma-70 family)